MYRIFGTDGVRGLFPEFLSFEFVRDLAVASNKVLTGKKAVIGADTRESGPILTKAIIDGLEISGTATENVGIVPTPAIPILIKEFKADFGVMISASHNPYMYNGIKFFTKDGFKLSDEIENSIETELKQSWDFSSGSPVLIGTTLFEKCIATPEDSGNNTQSDINITGKKHNPVNDRGMELYIKKTLAQFSGLELKGLRIALDTSNGANYKIAPEVFRSLGAELILIGNNPDGKNINKDCGSTHLSQLSEIVVSHQCDMGFAFDGDADRMLCVDDLGNVIDGDAIMLVIAEYLKSKNKLKRNTIVATVMSNIGFIKAAEKLGITVLRADVGDRYVLEMMQKGDYSLGGEQSGHVIALDFNSTGDGLLSALLFLQAVNELGKTPREFRERIKSYPQILKNVNVNIDKKLTYKNNFQIYEAIKKLENKYDGNGRVLIRPSGTEPLIRVMIEGEDLLTIEKDADELIAIITTELC